ncbi:MAG: hypothetical protein A2X25_10610 [Chloroflexi bacterium GWB2_49_20]|nr:MAG: hypothetical protein A2X25_10610 [Chloroflexi bacterium GWB2_49_20]OGN78987.1 MAG: hypothetical protein A2X26_00745 [Chloroflexi bacterium GWC2_49_37]OGN86252.1 MAG: hypothetical protein A2X27_05035 [Chloroflexi bacterium GWD2_49_16]
MTIKIGLVHQDQLKTQLASKEELISEPVNFLRKGSGQPAILIHGLAASLHDWDYLLPDLASAGFDACALDLLGHGDSFNPARLEDYNIQNVYAHFARWLDSLFPLDAVFLIGHSLGGYLALIHAIRNPHRIKGLVLVNPYYSMDQMSGFLRMIFRHPLFNTSLIRMTPYWLFRILIDLTSLELGLKYRQHHSLPEEVRIQTALDYKRAAPGIYNIPRTLVELYDQLSGLTIPTLVVWGEHDRTLDPSSFYKLAKVLPNSISSPMPTCGHVPHQCDSITFNKLVLDFFFEHR